MKKNRDAGSDETTVSDFAADRPTAEHVAEAPPPAPPPEVNTAEHWAELAGLLPEIWPGGVRNQRSWWFAAAKHLRRWPEGAEMTKAEFSAAVTQATVGTSHG